MRRTFGVLFLALSLGLFANAANAQQTGGVTGGNTGGLTGGNTGGLTGGTGGFGDLFGGGGGFNLGDGFTLQQEVQTEPSLRYENGFVGVSSADINGEGDTNSQGFIGGRNEGDFGGDINSSLGQNTATRQGGGAAGGVQGGFVGGNSLFFSVQRQSLRTRLRPDFISRTLAQGPLIGQNFVSRMGRIPAVREVATGYNISVQNRTATVTGVVPSKADADRIVRQLRLEPGVYRINNQLQFQQ